MAHRSTEPHWLISTQHGTHLAARVLVRFRAHFVEEICHGSRQQRRGLLPTRHDTSDASDEGRRRLERVRLALRQGRRDERLQGQVVVALVDARPLEDI